MKYALAIGYPLRMLMVRNSPSEEIELRNSKVVLDHRQTMRWGNLNGITEIAPEQQSEVEELVRLGVVVKGESAGELLSALSACLPVRQGFCLPADEGPSVWLGEKQWLLTTLQALLWFSADGATSFGSALENAANGWQAQTEQTHDLILENVIGLLESGLYYLR